MASVEERIKKVVSSILNVREEEITPASSFAADLGAESIQSVELVAAFEEEFDIDMDEDEALTVQSVGAAVEYISKVMKEQGKL